MNIAIMGSSGYIAGYLIKRFENAGIARSILKLDKDKADMAEYLDLSAPGLFDYSIFDTMDYLILTAAVSSPDQCAMNFNHCWDINVAGTTALIEKAIEKKCRVVFFSSDAVFGDIPGAIYDELSETYATTPYGRMKKAVEDHFRGSPYFKALRLSYVVSKRDKFTSYCLNCIKDGSEANIFHPFYRNCVTITDVLDIIEWLVTGWERLESNFINVSGQELVSRLRIADELNRIFQNKLRYKITTPSPDFYTNRPAITQTRSIYLESMKIIKMQSFTEKLKKELEDNK